MESFYKKSLSEIQNEATDALYGNHFIFGIIIILITMAQSLLSSVQIISIIIASIIAPIVAYIFNNLALSVIDNKKLNMDDIFDFKYRGIQIVIGGLIINFGLKIMTILFLTPIYVSSNLMTDFISFMKEFVLYGQFSKIAPILKLIPFGGLQLSIMAVIVFIVYLMIRVSFFYCVISDNDLKVFDAIGKSFEITKGYMIRITLFYLYFGFAIFVPLLLLYLISLYINLLFPLFFVLYLLFYGFLLIPTYFVSRANLYRTIIFEKYGDLK